MGLMMTDPDSLLKLLDQRISYDHRGLVPTIVQDANTGQVLMLAYSNTASLLATIEVGEAHFFSRSRQQLWHKGATSGNRMPVRKIALDCDQDTLLFLVDPLGPACHTGSENCFFEIYDL